MGSADVVEAVLRHRDDAAQALGDPSLHLGEGVPPRLCVSLVAGFGVFHLDAAVHRDRVVDRAQDREAGALDAEQPVAEALVVLYQVELGDPGLQVIPGSQREGERFGERAHAERSDLSGVHPRLELPETRHPHGEVVVVDVEARQLHERDAFVEDRVRLTRQHLDVVTEVGEGFGEVTGVDALPPDMRFSAIGQVGDAERVVRPRCSPGDRSAICAALHSFIASMARHASVKPSAAPRCSLAGGAAGGR